MENPKAKRFNRLIYHLRSPTKREPERIPKEDQNVSYTSANMLKHRPALSKEEQFFRNARKMMAQLKADREKSLRDFSTRKHSECDRATDEKNPFFTTLGRLWMWPNRKSKTKSSQSNNSVSINATKMPFYVHRGCRDSSFQSIEDYTDKTNNKQCSNRYNAGNSGTYLTETPFNANQPKAAAVEYHRPSSTLPKNVYPFQNVIEDLVSLDSTKHRYMKSNGGDELPSKAKHNFINQSLDVPRMMTMQKKYCDISHLTKLYGENKKMEEIHQRIPNQEKPQKMSPRSGLLHKGMPLSQQ